jgi:hypothetical protein
MVVVVIYLSQSAVEQRHQVRSESWYNETGRRFCLTEKGGMADEKITFGQNGNSASDNLDAVGLFLAGRR